MIQKFVSNLSEREKFVLFYFAIPIVTISIIYSVFFRPVLSKINTIEKDIIAEKSNIELDLKILARKNTILKKREILGNYFNEVAQDEDVVNADFLSTFERLASRSNVNIVKSNPSESKKEKIYSEYYANLDCTGTLKDVIQFMHLINSSEELLKIVSFNMTPKRGSEAGEVNASMTIVKLLVDPNNPAAAAVNP